MRTTAAVVALAGLLLLPSPGNAESSAPLKPGATGSGLRLQVRTYDRTALAPEIRDAMRQVAGSVLAAAGIQLTWLACDPGFEAAGCPAPLERHELALRLVRTPAPDAGGTVTLGYSLINPLDRPGALATIYVDRASRLAGQGALDLPTVLGRAAAHEIGHLLLGTNRHSDVGVMRATWSPADLLRNRPGDWAFTVEEADRLQSALMQRTRTR